MSHPSRYLNARQQRGLDRLGDALLPGDEAFPSFSRLGCGEHVDKLLAEMPQRDRGDVLTLLTVCGALPTALVRLLVALIESSDRVPTPLGATLRFAKMGVRGLVLTLYYSGLKGSHYAGRTPLEILGYEVGVYTADVEVRHEHARNTAL
ncbi:MAG: hypothetical protein K2Y37_03250 [Pirellulales bacterium]|nr:hypothetical protein [Pirellulales bacterium]